VWPEGRVSGLKARGGYEVSMEWKAGQLVNAEIRSALGGSCKVRYGGKVIQITTQRGKRYQVARRFNQN